MSYEHSHSIQFDLDHLSQYENVIELEEKKNELDEVYAKAEAFNKIRQVDKDFYKEYGYYPNEEEWWYDASNIIEKYEELHGGHKQWKT